MMRFNSEKTAFGRHETFPLRYSWLTKGIHALLEDSTVFQSDEATVTLGVGKNMVSAIRYWIEAAQLAERRDGQLILTQIGEELFSPGHGYDPYMEDEATIWLIHWLIASNAELATAWYWFFNRFHKPEFTSQEVGAALVDFVKSDIKTRVAASTVKQDAAILLRMYTQSSRSARTPLEEALDSPLSLLGLVSHLPGSKRYQSRPDTRDGLPVGVFAYAVADYLQFTKAKEVPIEELMYGRAAYPAIGGVFRLTEAGLISKLEEMVRVFPGAYETRETAGVHQLYLLEEKPKISYLDHHYSAHYSEVAA